MHVEENQKNMGAASGAVTVSAEALDEISPVELTDSRKGFTLQKFIYYAFVICSSLLCIFHLHAALVGTVSLSRQRIVHISLILIMGILYDKHKRLSSGKKVRAYEWAWDIFMAGSACFAAPYMYMIDLKLHTFSGSPNTQLLFIGIMLTISLLIVTNRSMGRVMSLIAVISLLYVFFGHNLTGVLNHRQYSLARVATVMLLSEDGILGVPLGVSAGTVILFVIFGSALSATGGGQAFIDLTYSFFGKIRGGPAKIAVVSSALFGTINGSAVANVMTTGVFTIPLMKRVGYPAYYAGAVEAVASTGGQIMPPIMGAAAFVMAQVLNVPYMDVVKVAIIPALLYYFMVFVSVDFMALKQNLKALDPDSIPKTSEVLKKTWFLLVPIVALIYFMVVENLSANKSALYSIGLSVFVSCFSKEYRLTPKKIIQIFVDAGKGIMSVALACATAGIIIGALALTGLAVKLSGILINLAGGNLYILMCLTAVVGIIMGMGLPTTGVYVILASLAAPALVQLGVSKMAAHMFVFYYGVIAVITPPVALASYAAAGISGASPGQTGWFAVKLGLAGFLMPVMFILNPPIMLEGSFLTIVRVVITSTIAITAMSASLTGVYAYTIFGRTVMAIGSLLLLDGGLMTDIIGIILCAAVLAVEHALHKNKTSQGTQI